MVIRLATASLDLPTLKKAVELLVDALLQQIRSGQERAATTWTAALMLIQHPTVLGALARDPELLADVRIVTETREADRSYRPVYRDAAEHCAESAIRKAVELSPRLADWTDPTSARPGSTNAPP